MAISLVEHLAKFDLKTLVDVIQRNEWFLVPDLAHRIGGALDSVVTIAKRKLDETVTAEEATAKKAKVLEGDTVVSGILGSAEGKAMLQAIRESARVDAAQAASFLTAALRKATTRFRSTVLLIFRKEQMQKYPLDAQVTQVSAEDRWHAPGDPHYFALKAFCERFLLDPGDHFAKKFCQLRRDLRHKQSS
jgi:hypothetical protein